MSERSLTRSRTRFKDFTEEQKRAIFDRAWESIFDWVCCDARGATEMIMDGIADNYSAMMDWVGTDGFEDEEVYNMLGFWPWEIDPIPLSELGLEE